MKKATARQLKKPITETLDLESQLARGYYEFLMQHDPQQLWSDIEPLETPIAVEETYDLSPECEAQAVSQLPWLAVPLAAVRFWNQLAPHLGWRYAWTRLHMHCALLKRLPEALELAGRPKAILEPGVFTGGLAHYLPLATGLSNIGVDSSPVALDVCRQLETEHQLTGTRDLLRCDFRILRPERLQEYGYKASETVVLLSNFLNNSGDLESLYGWIHDPTVAAWLISYWVNAGATVVLCERRQDPEDFFHHLVAEGRWGPNIEAGILNIFETLATEGQGERNLLGTWAYSKCLLGVFYRKR
jgi:hypothetical protein